MPGVNQAIAWLLSHEVMSTVRRASWTALNLRRRLELQLMEISVLHGQVQDGWSRITLPLTQQELADLAVASRERVSRAMAQLTQAGRIRREGGWLLVRTEEGGAVRP